MGVREAAETWRINEEALTEQKGRVNVPKRGGRMCQDPKAGDTQKHKHSSALTAGETGRGYK